MESAVPQTSISRPLRAKFFRGYAVLFFELSVEVGHVVESHLIGNGGNFVGSVTQLIACDSKSVVVDVIHAGTSRELLEKFHGVKLAVTAIFGNLLNGNLEAVSCTRSKKRPMRGKRRHRYMAASFQSKSHE